MLAEPDRTAPPVAGPGRREHPWPRRWRWLVHLALLATAAGTLATLQLLHVRNAIHAVIGLAFGALVLVHLVQRRHRIARLFAQLWARRRRVGRELRLLASDTILFVVAANVIISGIVDWDRGQPVSLPLPRPFSRWHLVSALVLVVYLVVHVARRWRRLRRSTVR